MRQWGIEYEPDQQHVSRALKALGLTNAKGVATLGTDDMGGPKASEISELRRAANWHDPPEEIKEEDDLLFLSVAVRFNVFAVDWPDLLYEVKELMRKMASPHTQDITALKRVARYTIKYPRMTCRHRWTELDSKIEVFGDANFAGCNSTRKSTVGSVAMWSGQFVKAWSKTMGVLAWSSGESELAAVVRAATEGMGLQSILNDFCSCGHVAIKSDATAAIEIVHRLGLGKVRHLAVGDLWVQHHVRSGKIQVSKMSGLENPSDAQTKYLGPEPLLRHTKACNWVPVVDDGQNSSSNSESPGNTIYSQEWNRVERSTNSGSYSVQLASGNREHGVYSEHSGGLSDSPATANCGTTREEVGNGVGNERLPAVGECFPSPENNHPFKHATPGGA